MPENPNLLYEVFNQAVMDSYGGPLANPWEPNAPQHAVYELGWRAGREVAEWEASDEFARLEAEEAAADREVREALVRWHGGDNPDDLVRFIHSACRNILAYLAMNGPSVAVNGDRRRLLDLSNRLVRIPTETERQLGWTPMEEFG